MGSPLDKVYCGDKRYFKRGSTENMKTRGLPFSSHEGFDFA